MTLSLIFKKQDRGESDELVIFFSREFGWLRGIAKNAKKSRIRFGGHLETLSLADLTLRQRKRDDLVWIDDSQVVEGFLAVRSNIKKVAYASYFLELASVFLATDQPDIEIFDFMVEFMRRMEAGPLNSTRLMLDEIWLLGNLGYSPSFDFCPHCGKTLAQNEYGFFVPDFGGACHDACTGLHAKFRLSPSSLAVLRKSRMIVGEALERLRLSQRDLKELRHAVSAYVRHLRGADFNSLVFMEKFPDSA